MSKTLEQIYTESILNTDKHKLKYKHSVWTDHEIDLLHEGVKKYGYGKWFEISKMIGTKSNRQVCNKYRCIYLRENIDPSKLNTKFTDEEDQAILEWVRQFGTGGWDKIGEKMGRTGSS
jgi:hypothetical protein